MPDLSHLRHRPSLTYRGYLGADVRAPATWMHEDSTREAQSLLRMAASVGRLGAWSVQLPAMEWTWSAEVKTIHEVPLDWQPTTDGILAFYSADSREMLMDAFEGCARHGQAFDLELELRTARGRRLWIRAIGEAERDARGRVTHVRGAIQDVTRFRAATDEARLGTERFMRTLETVADGFILLDQDWRFLYLNSAAARILRRDPQQLKGRSLLVEFPETAAGTFLQRCEQAIRDGSIISFDRYYRPLGIWVSMRFSATELGLSFSLRDDTERILARRELMRLRAELQRLRS